MLYSRPKIINFFCFGLSFRLYMRNLLLLMYVKICWHKHKSCIVQTVLGSRMKPCGTPKFTNEAREHSPPRHTFSVQFSTLNFLLVSTKPKCDLMHQLFHCSLKPAWKLIHYHQWPWVVRGWWWWRWKLWWYYEMHRIWVLSACDQIIIIYEWIHFIFQNQLEWDK